jgi:hypothetical protein
MAGAFLNVSVCSKLTQYNSVKLISSSSRVTKAPVAEQDFRGFLFRAEETAEASARQYHRLTSGGEAD